MTPVPAMDCGILGRWIHSIIHTLGMCTKSFFTVLSHLLVNVCPSLKTTAARSQDLLILDRNEVRTQTVNLIFKMIRLMGVLSGRTMQQTRMRWLLQILLSAAKSWQRRM